MFLSDDAGSATNHIEPVQSERTVAVRCIRIDTVCSEHAIQPQYVKIDVEGFEYDVLAGFGSFLNAIDLLMIEMNGLSDQRSHGQREIHELLTSNRINGPWQCDFDRKTLRRTDESGIEDSLYLSDHAGDMLQKYGFKLVG